MVSAGKARFAETADDLRIPALFERANRIINGGTSADRQLAVFNQALQQQPGPRSALSQVVDHLLEETSRS